MSLQPPKHLSPSSIGTFEQCPLKFKYSRIDGLSEPPTIHTLLGNFVHSILEDLYSLPADERTIQQARIIARNQWESVYGGSAKSMNLNERDFRWKAWYCIENLWKMENPSTVEVGEVEREVLGEIRGVSIKGFVDRYRFDNNGKLIVEDYKTGKVPNPNYLEDKFFQLLVYASMLKELEVGDTSTVSLLYLAGTKRFNKKVTQDDLDKTVNKIVETKQAVDMFCEQEKFPAKPSSLCNWCHFKKICPAWATNKR